MEHVLLQKLQLYHIQLPHQDLSLNETFEKNLNNIANSIELDHQNHPKLTS